MLVELSLVLPPLVYGSLRRDLPFWQILGNVPFVYLNKLVNFTYAWRAILLGTRPSTPPLPRRLREGTRVTRRNLRLMAVAWCIFLPLFLVAFTGTPAQPSPRRRPRARRVTGGGEGAIGPTGTTRASSTAERAPVPPMSGTSITARAFTRRAATGMVVVALAVAALVYPVSLTVYSRVWGW